MLLFHVLNNNYNLILKHTHQRKLIMSSTLFDFISVNSIFYWENMEFTKITENQARIKNGKPIDFYKKVHVLEKKCFSSN